MSSARPQVPLTIAGSDPSGGAGLQADLKVFLRLGFSGAAVPTAWTVQGPSGLKQIKPLSGRDVKAQLDALLADMRPCAVKVGMLPSAEVVRAVARALHPLAAKKIPIVVDPVLRSSSGRRVLPKDDVAIFMRQLVPLATILTPNIDEAAELSGMSVDHVRSDTEAVIRELLRAGARNVLIKGGHLSGKESVDILGTRREYVMFSLPRIAQRKQVHGTGCALSSAIAALLGKKMKLDDAVEMAKQYVHAAIEGAKSVGRGSRMLDYLASPEESEFELPEMPTD
ncbi:MAG: bifunctional hydroxymethylpyrimidine kinase/phosphomethylpyrimidine kinase [Planctomycetota bacterium]|nr:bifunctional hydroxymethylpyrimidine kinase/phosphomethylpyrimidine kinase [Planctomycetota bacterium]